MTETNRNHTHIPLASGQGDPIMEPVIPNAGEAGSDAHTDRIDPLAVAHLDPAARENEELDASCTSHAHSRVHETDPQQSVDAKPDNPDDTDLDDPKSSQSCFGDTDEYAAAGERHMATLTAIHGQIEQAARTHDREMRGAFRETMASLHKKMQDGEEDRRRLAEFLHKKDEEISALHKKADQERELHEQEKRLAEDDRCRSEEQHGREHREALAALRAEMAQESEKRVSTLLQELGREAEERVEKVRTDMARARAELELERDQLLKEMKAEMARLAEREREARERAKRAEMAQRSDEYRQSLQTWAIARLWGVGQTRAR